MLKYIVLVTGFVFAQLFSSVALANPPKNFCKTANTWALTSDKRKCKRATNRAVRRELARKCPVGSRKKWDSVLIGELGTKKIRPWGGDKIKVCTAKWKVCVTCIK